MLAPNCPKPTNINFPLFVTIFQSIKVITSIWKMEACGICLTTDFLCSTLRSWVHNMFSHFRTVSPGLGDNYASKCSSANFPHTKYVSLCVEKSQNHTLMFHFSPIWGEGLKSKENYGTDFPIVFLAFQTFSSGLDKNKTSMCGSESFPRMVTYILWVENCQNYILTHCCLPIPGRLF